MIKTFTQSDLIRYIYNEMSPKEAVAIQEAILCDNALHEEHKSLRQMVALLDELVEPDTPSSVVRSRSKV
jgi:anti-sigma factor RsiW